VGVPVDIREALRFTGAWRHSQELALAAFDADRAAGRRRTHIVAPPGSGKTLIGLEIIRRLGAPALVLTPNTAVQAQWLHAAGHFGAPAGLVRADAGAPVACLTYQGMSRLDDPATVVGDLAERRWGDERAHATGTTREAVIADAATWTGEAARRRDRERATITASVKREIARAEHGDLHVGDLLSDGVRERLDALRSSGTGTVVLDECHHLASLWGYVVRAVVEELGDVHLVGLTATPPGELTRDEADLYDHLLGPVDFTVPIPAVVRDGHLAPYQELAMLATPLDSEVAWLAERDTRFRELITALHEPDEHDLGFVEWVVRRLRTRMVGEDDGIEVPWGSFARREPHFAAAGLRMLASAGLPLPEGAPHGEAFRVRPNLDDWLLLLEDYALRCLVPRPDAPAAARYEAIGAALTELGFTLTRRGIRRGRSDVDRLLTRSAAKSHALADIVACELDARADRLRALVLTDAERAESTASSDLLSVLRPEAGTAVEAVRALADDPRTAVCHPVLVSGRGVRCAPDDADRLIDCLLRVAPPSDPALALRWEMDDDKLARIVGETAWTPRRWVPLVTAALSAGHVLTLVGTRGMLGEGWDAPSVNVVVDMTSAATSVAVTQMRGRSLRLDPADPDKVASNWDVVCVAPGLLRGDGDYRRFVRKHLHVFAPTDDGEIEAGPSHVHPALGPFEPPDGARFDRINRDLVDRARDHDGARDRWRLGEPYEGVEVDTVVVRVRDRVDTAPAATPISPPDVDGPSPQGPVALGAVSAGAAVVASILAGPVGLAVLVGVPAAAGWFAARRHRAAGELAGTLPLDLVAAAIRDAYVELGEIDAEAGASLCIEPRSSGYLRAWLARATPRESALFADALHDLIDPSSPRYLVSRPVRLVGPLAGLRTAFGRVWTAPEWVPVPADLGRRRDRAEVFARACARWLGPGTLVSAVRSPAGAAAFAESHAADHRIEAARRRVWR